jgi:hypothetical protein
MDYFTRLKNYIYELQGNVTSTSAIRDQMVKAKNIAGEIIKCNGVSGVWSGMFNVTTKPMQHEIYAIVTFVKFKDNCDHSKYISFVSLIENNQFINQYNSYERYDYIIDYFTGINIGICDACIGIINPADTYNEDYEIGYMYSRTKTINFMRDDNNVLVYTN